MAKLVPTIGLEIHVQLKTASKMFCRCNNDAEGKDPNTTVCPVCMGFPGTLPVTNEQAIKWGALVGLMLECKINNFQRFDRKNYFYPDLPKGYQVSQFFYPVGENGKITIDYQEDTGKEPKEFTVRIMRVHLEEDAGKLMHAKDGTLVDFNRCGTPLLEIVTEPDIHSSREAKAFLQELQRVVRSLGVSDADMEKGQMRCDANISMAEEGSSELGTLVELKNMNSFRFIEKALEFELKRQTEVIESGGEITKETRGFDEKNGTTLSQRSKEEFNDYRYFPEPDLPPINLSEGDINELKNGLIELPSVLRKKAIETDLVYSRIIELQETDKLLRFVNVFKEANVDASLVANWVGKKWESDTSLAGFLQTISKEKLSSTEANQLYKLAGESDQNWGDLVSKIERLDIKDIEKIIDEVIADNEKAASEYKAGEQKAIGFLMGQIMKKLGAKGDPSVIKPLLEEKIS
ncbi:MAG: Asp-tRNA(Asn)/Glu-tRNA(Gln) amidotransferase subunit GatB [Patescibacteria group bacterium]|nr:Asp-tRNA(Asn)/Glu-tRNA(Gln) amidotransferase subunit GatB [Patescibacteria group bacterium]